MARKSRKKKNVAEEAPIAPLYKVGIYCRLSVANNEDVAGNSLGNQKKICMAYLQKQPDMEYCQTYMDNGKTGTNFERPAFKAMLDDIQNGLINCVLVKDLSRFGRNFIETSMYLDLRFPEWGVRLIAVNNGFDTLYAHSEEGGYDISIPFYNILSEYYARDISKKITAVVRTKMEKGTFISSSVPLGYIPDREHCTYQIDPIGAEIVRYIFQRRSEGASPSQIAWELNLKKYPTPIQRKRELGLPTGAVKAENEGIWAPFAVKRILGNQQYAGTRYHLQRDSNAETIAIPNAHEALIPPDMYDQVKKVKQEEESRSSHSQRTSISAPNFKRTMGDSVICGLCQQKMYVARKGAFEYFACSTNKKNLSSNSPLKCPSVSISSRQITQVLIQYLLQQVSLTVEMEAMLAELRAEAGGNSHYHYLMKQQRSFAVKIKGAKSYLTTLPFDLAEDRITAEEYADLKGKYRCKLEALERDKSQIDLEFAECQAVITKAEAMLDVFQHFRDTSEVDERLLTTLVKKIAVFPEHHLEITLNYHDCYQDILKMLRQEDCNG